MNEPEQNKLAVLRVEEVVAIANATKALINEVIKGALEDPLAELIEQEQNPSQVAVYKHIATIFSTARNIVAKVAEAAIQNYQIGSTSEGTLKDRDEGANLKDDVKK